MGDAVLYQKYEGTEKKKKSFLKIWRQRRKEKTEGDEARRRVKQKQ